LSELLASILHRDLPHLTFFREAIRDSDIDEDPNSLFIEGLR